MDLFRNAILLQISIRYVKINMKLILLNIVYDWKTSP